MFFEKNFEIANIFSRDVVSWLEASKRQTQKNIQYIRKCIESCQVGKMG